MADLRELFTGLSYTGVSTLLNSGNVVFNGPRLAAGAEKRIEDAFARKFGFTSRMTVLTGAEITQIVDEDPVGTLATDPSRYLISIFNQASHREKLVPLMEQSWHPEVLCLGTRVAYVWCPAGLMESRLQKAVGRLLGDAVTTRNWATILKLHTLVSKA